MHHEAAWLFIALCALACVVLVEVALGVMVITRRKRDPVQVPDEAEAEPDGPPLTGPSKLA